MELDNISKEQLECAVKNSKTYTHTAKLLNINYCNGNVIKKIAAKTKEYGISILHFSKSKYDAGIIKCLWCNKDIKISIGSKNIRKFCSKKCSAIYNNTGSIQTIETRKKISETFQRKINSGEIKVFGKKAVCGKKEIICKICKNKFFSKRKRIYCSNTCRAADLDLKKKMIESCRLVMNEKVKNGTHKGWKSRNKLEPSYPEKYFMDVLKNENIKYEHEKNVGKYFIDFALIEKMIALEIDGKQHEEEKRKLSDIHKDVFLEKSGWKIFRIKWKNPISTENKEILYNQIKNFKEFYSTN